MARRDQERAADADREQIAERLRHAVDEGRLDLDEFDDRLAQAYHARTYGELDRLVQDLPAPTPVPAVPGQRYPHPIRAWLLAQWQPWFNVVVICTAIWLFTSLVSQEPGYFWPIWVAVPWGVVMVWRTIYGLSSGEAQQWAAGASRPPEERNPG